MKKRKASIKFVGRKHSKYGLISTIIGGISSAILLSMIYVTIRSNGTTEVWLGLLGLLLLMVSLAGLILGVSGLKQKDIFYTLPILGVAINGVLFISMVVLYFLGLSMIVG